LICQIKLPPNIHLIWYYLYGNNVTIVTDHAAVKAISGAPNLTGKHARWWSKVYRSGIKHIDIAHHPGKRNSHADCLFRQLVMPPPPDEDANVEVQITLISSEQNTIITLLEKEPKITEDINSDTFSKGSATTATNLIPEEQNSSRRY